ncbi:hypothetical protein B6E66_15885 [Streptomyces maremycinicus]|nr:hypothetical protein B6E66_15885 [Streptomyces sp. B9173]
MQGGDGTDDRTGWPAVIRGRREQNRRCLFSEQAITEGRAEEPNAIRIARALVSPGTAGHR